MNKKILIFTIFLLGAVYAKAQTVGLSGFVRNYTSLLYDNGDFNMLQNTFNLNFELRSDKVALKANPLIPLQNRQPQFPVP